MSISVYKNYLSIGQSSLSASKSQDEMESRFLLDIVIRKGSAILKLLTGEDKSLLIWWDTLLVLDLSLDVLNGVSWLDIKGDGLTGEGLDENLHFLVDCFINYKKYKSDRLSNKLTQELSNLNQSFSRTHIPAIEIRNILFSQ